MVWVTLLGSWAVEGRRAWLGKIGAHLTPVLSQVFEYQCICSIGHMCDAPQVDPPHIHYNSNPALLIDCNIVGFIAQGMHLLLQLNCGGAITVTKMNDITTADCVLIEVENSIHSRKTDAAQTDRGIQPMVLSAR